MSRPANVETTIKRIEYKGGYKYVLQKHTVFFLTGFKFDKNIWNPFLSLTPLSSSLWQLTLLAGYAWDGPSGPTIDTKTFMRGSLAHDALYQLMREGFLDPTIYRKRADEILREICLEDGMNPIRAWWVYNAVRICGAKAATRNPKEDLEVAP